MKKILLTTSALTLLAGAAVADVNVSGYGHLGISSVKGKTTQYNRINLHFSGESTTDNGLTFKVTTRARSNNASTAKLGSGTNAFSAPWASISNGAMTLALGNQGGAISATAGIWGCGDVMFGANCFDMTDNGFANWATRSTNGAGPDIIRLDMALGGATVSVSGGNSNDAELAVSMPLGGGSVGVGYDNDNAAAESNPITQINYSGSMGGLGVGLKLLQQDGVTAYVGSVKAPAGAGSVYMYVGKNLAEDSNYGVRYDQSLGGGASFQVGANNTAKGDTIIGAGVKFGF